MKHKIPPELSRRKSYETVAYFPGADDTADGNAAAGAAGDRTGQQRNYRRSEGEIRREFRGYMHGGYASKRAVCSCQA